MSDGRRLVARLARADVNMPTYDAFSMDFLLPEFKFECDVYSLLPVEPTIPTPRLLYHRAPVQHDGPRVCIPQDIAGRRLMVFERADGKNNVWGELSLGGKVLLSCSLSSPWPLKAHLNLPPADLGFTPLSGWSHPRVLVQLQSSSRLCRDLATQQDPQLHAKRASSYNRPYTRILGCNVQG